jgi:hypothetical protein
VDPRKGFRGPLAELLFTRYDPVAMIRVASGEQLRIARKVAFELAGFGSFGALHAALLPDTPGLAALRQAAVSPPAITASTAPPPAPANRPCARVRAARLDGDAGSRRVRPAPRGPS